MTEAYSTFPVTSDLPLEVSRFVGRRFDRGRIRELVGRSRMVTLTGIGGIGKSRLALRMATELRRSFRDVFVVALGGIVDPGAVPVQISATLELHDRAAHSGTIAIVEYLRTRHALLVLDNCEHVIEAAARIADTLLRTCSDVHILATSREPLRIEGEVIYPLAPLSIPGHDSDQPLLQYEAVQLFLDRAQAVLPDFVLTDDNRDSVSAISRSLEGIPLAIELAAAQLRAFSPSELLAQLTDRWEFLGPGSRTAPNRHSTIAACIEWSFDLCTPAERLLWAQASIFVDEFGWDAIRSVCYESDHEVPLEQTLVGLVDKSVVIAAPRGATVRYRMLPPIRHRGRQELARIGQETALRRRHKDFYIGLMEQARDGWFGPRQTDCIERLRMERGNMDQALEWCVAQPDSADQALRALGQLRDFVILEGRFQRGREWIDRLLAGGAGEPASQVLALRTAAWWAALQGDTESATRMVDEGRVLATQLDRQSETFLDEVLGLVALMRGDAERAEQLLNKSARRFATDGNDAEKAICSGLLALTHALLGDAEGALEHERACLAIAEPAGELWLRSWCHFLSALALGSRGESEAAREQASQGLRLKARLGDTPGIAFLLETFAWLAAPTDPERAALLLGAAQNEWDKVDTTAEVTAALSGPHRQTTSAAQAQLSETQFEKTWSRGRALDQSAAIALALGEQTMPRAEAKGEMRTRLTRRQREIAELIHRGLSNKEIAASLVISPRTAETHVENILTTLGFSRRAQIASWFGEQLESDND
jgi:serine/threonine-protein kinase PknK